MLTIYPYENLGRANHGWLDARHHFSFASYRNPERMQFGALRVINDDIIKSGTGFDTHPHKNMEIITFVREGAITHKDSNGNEGRTGAGDVQVMSAGTGVYHSEFNFEEEDTRLFQIWIEPNQLEVPPSWGSHEFPKAASKEALTLLVSGDGDAPLQIKQDAYIYTGFLETNAELTHPIKHQVYILVSDGELQVNGHVVKKGDGIEITQKTDFSVKALTDARLLVIDVPEVAR